MAEKFARALVEGQFEVAYQLLSCKAKEGFSPLGLKSSFESMIEYGGGPITHVEVMNTLEDWPAKQEEDIGWAYVAVSGDDYSEAVTVVVAREATKSVIREIEWGRP